MHECEYYVLVYCKRIYGIEILYRNRAFYIKTTDDTYKIDFSLSKRHIYQFYSVTRPLVLTETCLARAFFRLSAHSTYKEAKQIPTFRDWENFLNDAYKQIYLEELNEQN